MAARRWLAALAVLGGLLAVPVIPAHASEGSALGNAILNTAESRAGYAYQYGGAGPDAFDCSGLVVWAAAQHGVYLPRETWAMESSPLLERIPLSDVQRGDLLFFNGGGHVEFATVWPQTTFGAHDWGQPVGWLWWGSLWYGAVAYRIV